GRNHREQTTGAVDSQSDRPASDGGSAGEGKAPPAAAARRISRARPARFLRVGTGVHGRLRPQELSDRAIAQPDREGLWAEQRTFSIIVMCACPLRRTTSGPYTPPH